MKIPDYCLHDKDLIKGFFGEFRFLSNFWPATIHFYTQVFPTVEHAYVAAKGYENFDLHEYWEDWVTNKLNGMKASEVKREGRKFRLPKNWEETKFDLMASLVFDKFYRNKELRALLLETGNRYLEETNNWNDRIWGVCHGEGQNHLGKILMQTRSFWQELKS